MSCIFCKIANGEIPSATVYEDENIRAILDINPMVYGHTLIMPKKHFASLLECDDDTIRQVFEVAARIGRHMEETLECDGINILSNIRPGAGQTVDHFHVHILPRFNDLPEKDAFSFQEGHLENPDLEEVLEKVRIVD